MRRFISILFALVLVLSFSLVAAVPAAVAANGPNPTFCTVNTSSFPMLTTPSTKISIGWERDPNIAGDGFLGTDAVHVTTSVATLDYAMVIVPTDFILGESTGISYWGYTVTDSQVKAPDEIFLFLDTGGDGAVDTLLTSHKPGGLAEFYGTWDEWNSTDPVRLIKEGPGNEWHNATVNYSVLVDPNNYSTARVLAIALTAGPSTAGTPVDIDVYFDQLTVNGDVLLNEDTGTIDVPVPFLGQLAPSIQDAIDAALPGTTITVAAGNYNEVVKIDKPLTLLGARAGVDARTRTGPESVIDPNDPGGGAAKSWVVRVESSDVTVDGFTVQNPTLEWAAAGSSVLRLLRKILIRT